MAYPLHYLFAMSGTLGTGQDSEIWQCNIRGNFIGTDDQVDGWLNAVKGPVSAWYANVDHLLRNDSALTLLKCNQIGGGGQYENPNTTHEVSVNVSGASAINTPAFLSVVYSWGTANQRGYASKGRIYPPNCFTPTSNGQERMSAQQQAAHLAAAVALIKAIRQVQSPDNASFGPQVVSSHGERSDILTCRIGDVVDVQRRRKNKLRENYVSGSTT